MFDVLIVGCGNIAGGFDAAGEAGAPPLTHAGAFSENPAFRIAACVDPDANRRADFQTRWNVPHGVATIADLNAEPGSFDVVSICSPTAFHAEHLAAAIALRPRLIFCEKPVTPTAAETEHWTRRAGEAGILFAVNHTRRWAPDIVQLAADLRAGTRGTLRSVVATYNKGVLNNGAHIADLLLLLLGEVQVQSAGVPIWDHWPDDPTIPALLQSADGVPVTLAVADARDYALFEVAIITSTGVLTMEEGGLAWRERRAVPSSSFAGYQVLEPGERVAGSYKLAMRAAVANIRNALLDGEPLASDGASALAAQRLCEAIRAAATD